MNKQKLPKWFDEAVYDKGETVKNSFSGESCKLNAEELSMYKFIMSWEICRDQEHLDAINEKKEKCMDWFKETNPEAYKILLK